ncbi:hypothetical protein [Chengkuizengella marina]|uniref:hypothetical protein n=1 Tax=Chengkuizengella marina TaxID=2507566 RepID=UPI00136FF280|nr:hypothetical protein [Chengkuizengella marina]
MSSHSSGSGAALVLVLFILLVIILLASTKPYFCSAPQRRDISIPAGCELRL